MKILVITHLYPPHQLGGYELRCKNVVDRLIERGHDVEVLAAVCEDDRCGLHPNEKNIYRKLHNIHTIKSPIRKAYTILHDLRFLQKRIQRYKPDLIYLWHITSYTKDLMPFLAGVSPQIVCDEGGRGLSYMWNNHGAWHRFIDQKTESKILAVMKRIFISVFSKLSGNLLKAEWRWPDEMVGYFNSQNGLRYAQSKGVPTESFKVIHSGIDLDLFPYEGAEDTSPRKNILLPGRIEAAKGQKDGVEMLATLIQKNIPAHLTIVGQINSIEYYQEIQQYVKDNQLESNVSILPMVEYDIMADLYRRADICFFPSKHVTGFSRIPLEAMASGCLMITYGNEGSNEVIITNETGFVVSPGDYERICSIIQEVIENPAKTQKIIEVARKKIERNHSMGTYVNKIESLLISAAKKRPDK